MSGAYTITTTKCPDGTFYGAVMGPDSSIVCRMSDPLESRWIARRWAERERSTLMQPEKSLEQQGLEAQRAGVKWWRNPYPGGSVESARWDAGHTLGRKQH